MKEELFQTILTIAILFSLMVIIYLKITKKTISEFIIDLRESFSNKAEEIIEK